MAHSSTAKVKDSLLLPIPGSTVVGDSDPAESVQLTVRVRPRTPHHHLTKTVKDLASKLPAHRRHLSRDEFSSRHGADPADLDKVKAFASRHGLTVTHTSVARRSVHLLGTGAAVDKAFGIQLKTYEHGKIRYRGHEQQATVPADLGPIIEAIYGGDTRPYARPHFRFLEQPRGSTSPATASLSTTFTPLQLAQIYGFPPDADGTGQVIGILELAAPAGSGYVTSDLDSYFQSLSLTTPDIVSVSVDGAQNNPGTNPNDPQSADGEVALDVEIAGAISPKAKIVVYFAPNTVQGFADVISHAVHDSEHNPTVISMSWGRAEDSTDPTTSQIDQMLQAAAAMGVTFCSASGDSGSRDNLSDPNHAAVDFPASSPSSLGCGGTTLEASGTKITRKVVWQDQSGGGVSRIFDLPTYQENAGVPPAVNPAGPVRRGVPDVAGNADPNTGYNTIVGGQTVTVGGTSAVAPLWAGLAARLNQKLGHNAGFLNTILYQNPQAFNDITSGSNGDYNAGPGWDPCTGLGSPQGEAILQALSGTSTGTSPR